MAAIIGECQVQLIPRHLHVIHYRYLEGFRKKRHNWEMARITAFWDKTHGGKHEGKHIKEITSSLCNATIHLAPCRVSCDAHDAMYALHRGEVRYYEN